MDYTINDLPESERPREKLEDRGVSALSDVELLSLVLRAGTRGKNVKELSSQILKSHSLGELADRRMEELERFDGVSTVKAGQLKALGELGRRMQKQQVEKIESLSDLKPRIQDMKFFSSEKLRAFYLSSGNEILAEKEFEGSVSGIDVENRDIFEKALTSDASGLILVHNHPSGKTGATEEDLDFTRRFIETGRSLGVDLLDHVVVGDGFYSIRSQEDLW